jgi:hypothetical protein
MARGKNVIGAINLNENIYGGDIFVPSVQWDGKHMTISSTPKWLRGREGCVVSVYRLKLSGSAATVIGTTKLQSTKNRQRGQTWIHRTNILGMYDDKTLTHISVWAYPKGGQPRDVLAKFDWTNYSPTGVTVSVAPSR